MFLWNEVKKGNFFLWHEHISALLFRKILYLISAALAYGEKIDCCRQTKELMGVILWDLVAMMVVGPKTQQRNRENVKIHNIKVPLHLSCQKPTLSRHSCRHKPSDSSQQLLTAPGVCGGPILI